MSRTWLLGVGLAAGLSAPLAAQQTEPITPALTIDAASLDRIQKALAKPSVFRLVENPFRFYTLVESKPPSFAEHMKTWGDLTMTPITAPGGRPTFANSADVGALVGKLFGRYFRGRGDSQVQQLRDRISEELRALTPAPPPAPAPPR
jgi:hypothetical protein